MTSGPGEKGERAGAPTPGQESAGHRCLVCLLGRPGSGKTSALARVAERDDVLLVRVGDLLRARASQGPKAAALRRQMESGGLVDTDQVRDAVAEGVGAAEAPVVILDGFPRKENQIEPLGEIAHATGRELALILVLALPRGTAERRLTGRRVCSRCGHIYNIHYDPPPAEGCPCGGRPQRREDDRAEVARARQERFDLTTKPVIRWFNRHRPQLVRCVRAAGPRESMQSEVLGVLARHCVALAPGDPSGRNDDGDERGHE